MFEDAEDEDDECANVIEHQKENTTKVSFDVEHVTVEDVEETLHAHIEKHPDNRACVGIFHYVDELKSEIKEKEKERCELMNNQNCIVLTNCVNVNEIKAQDHECNELIEEHNELTCK